MYDDDRIAELLLQWEDCTEQGVAQTPEELCREYPELLSRFQAAVAKLRAFDALVHGTGQSDRGPALLSEHPLLPEIPGYQIVSRLAAGGMGVVYRARDEGLHRDLAIKLMLAGGQASEHEEERFRQEMLILAQLEHPYIVPIYQADCIEEIPYFVMPLMRHGSLAQRLDHFFGKTHDAVSIIEKVALAIDHAHQRGIYHRDLKPSNILLADVQTPRVSDFGVAKMLEHHWRTLEPNPSLCSLGEVDNSCMTRWHSVSTQSGALIGTYPYMAPEQITGDLTAVGAPADIWAMGVILYELLIGKRPFVGPGLERYRQQIVRGDFIPPRQADPELDRTLAAIIERCLAHDPLARYPSANRLAEDLHAWRTGNPVRGVHEDIRRQASRLIHRLSLPAAIAMLTAVLLFGRNFSGVGPKYPESQQTPPINEGERYRWRSQRNLDTLRGHSRDAWTDLVGSKYELPIGRIVYGKGDFWPGERRGSLIFQSAGKCLLELLPEMPLESYRIRARIRQVANEKGPQPFVGIYWGHCRSSNPTRFERPSYFAAVRFTDWSVLQQERHLCRADLWAIYGPSRAELTPDFKSQLSRADPLTIALAPANNLQDSPIRELVVEVHKDRIEAKVIDNEKKMLFKVSTDIFQQELQWYRDRLTMRERKHHHQVLAPPVPYDQHGGLGLFISGTSMEVLQYRLERIP